MKKYFIIALFILMASGISAQLKINPGTIWKSEATTVVVLNDLGIQNNAGSLLMENIFKFTGSTDVSITGTEEPLFRKVQLNKSGSGKLILGRSIRLNTEMEFVSGLMDLNGSVFYLNPAALFTNESEASHPIGNNGGDIRITTNLNAPSSANPGNLGAIISSGQNLGAVEIRRGHVSQTNISALGSSIKRYYDILPANNTGLDATLRINYFDAEVNGLSENNFIMIRSTDNQVWTNEGFNSRDAVTNYVEKTGIPSFSRWTVSSLGNLVPVTGLNLTGRWKNNHSELDWTTLTETNNSHFIVMRKYSDELNFVSIGQRPTAHPGGNSQLPANYHFNDQAESNRGIIFYRLMQVDRDGHFVYSNIITVNPHGQDVFIQKVYPTTIVQQSIYLNAGNLSIRTMEAEVFDMAGRLLMKTTIPYQSQWLKIPVVPSGTYQLRLSSGEWKFVDRFIKR